jgi:hypothetical protein
LLIPVPSFSSVVDKFKNKLAEHKEKKRVEQKRRIDFTKQYLKEHGFEKGGS